MADELRPPHLEDRALDGIFVDDFADCAHVLVFGAELRDGRIHHSHGAIGHRFAGEDASRNVGQLFANQSKVRNHFPESLALFRIRHSVFHAVTG